MMIVSLLAFRSEGLGGIGVGTRFWFREEERLGGGGLVWIVNGFFLGGGGD